MDVLLARLARQEHDVSDKVVHGDEEQKDRPDANDPVHLLDVNVYRQSTLDPLRKIKKDQHDVIVSVRKSFYDILIFLIIRDVNFTENIGSRA